MQEPANRLERRKQRTRAALIKAAQTFIAAGKLNAPIADITQAADVGMGSFYNHFASREELFEAAVAEVLDAHGALLDAYTATIDDPAETFCTSFRLTGRLFRCRPQESEILLASGVGLFESERGLAPRARRDISAAITEGRFGIDDPDVALAIAGGALLGLGNLLRAQPDRDDARTVDVVAEKILRVFGMTSAQARKLCERQLPDIADLGQTAASA